MLQFTQTKSGLCIICSSCELSKKKIVKIHYFRNIPYVSDIIDIEKLIYFLKPIKNE